MSSYGKDTPMADHHLLKKTPVDLGRLSLSEWDELAEHLDIMPGILQRIRRAVFLQGIPSLSKMDDLPSDVRQKLAGKVILHDSRLKSLTRSSDGSLKLTLLLHDDHLAETVIIPERKEGRIKKCAVSISSQVGCFFGCSFCATGQMGFNRNLSTRELADQVRLAIRTAEEEMIAPVTHLYFMGMGEPMHNYRAVSDLITLIESGEAPGPDPSRITISTVGLYRQIGMLASDHPKVKLAVSIHSANQEKRKEIMPISARLPLADIRQAIARHQRLTGHRVTLQYLLLDGVNDSPDDAAALVRFIGNLNINITLIMYNDVAGCRVRRTDIEKMESFRNVLVRAGHPVDVRWCRGEDIFAGCGQLQVSASRKRTNMSIRSNATDRQPDAGS